MVQFAGRHRQGAQGGAIFSTPSRLYEHQGCVAEHFATFPYFARRNRRPPTDICTRLRGGVPRVGDKLLRKCDATTERRQWQETGESPGRSPVTITARTTDRPTDGRSKPIIPSTQR